MKTPIRHGSVIKCDASGCAGMFTTYSEAKVARLQAGLAGWARVWAWQLVADPADPACELAPRILVDACPTHAAVAAVRKANRAQDLAERAARARAARIEAKEAKAAAWRAKQAAWAEARKVKAEVKQARAAARALQRAERSNLNRAQA